MTDAERWERINQLIAEIAVIDRTMAALQEELRKMQAAK